MRTVAPHHTLFPATKASLTQHLCLSSSSEAEPRDDSLPSLLVLEYFRLPLESRSEKIAENLEQVSVSPRFKVTAALVLRIDDTRLLVF